MTLFSNKIIIELDASFNYTINVVDCDVYVYNNTLEQHVNIDKTMNEDGTVTIQNFSINKYFSTLTTSQIYDILCNYINTQEYNILNNIEPYCLYQQNGNGETIFHLAVSEGNLEVIKFIIKKTDKDIFNNKTLSCNYTILHLAVLSENIEVISLLIHKIQKNDLKDLINELDYSGKSAFGYAISKNMVDVCKILYPLTSEDAICHQIKKTFNKGKESYYTNLHYAVKKNNYLIVELLLSKDTIALRLLDKTDNYGQNALHIAFELSSFEISKFLIDRTIQIYSNDKETLKNIFLAKCGVDGYTPLHIAIHNSNIQVIEYLLYKIYNIIPDIISFTDNHNQTPLLWAAGKGNFEIFKMLYPLMTTNDILLQTNNGSNLFIISICCKSPNVNIIKFLLSKTEIANKLILLTYNKGFIPLQLTSHINDIKLREEINNIIISYFIRQSEHFCYET